MLPEFKAVEQKGRAQCGGHDDQHRAAPRVEHRPEPGTCRECGNEPDRGNDVDAPDADRHEQRRREEWEQLGCHRVRVVRVDPEERLDVRDRISADSRQRNFQRMGGEAHRVARRDQLDARIPTKNTSGRRLTARPPPRTRRRAGPALRPPPGVQTSSRQSRLGRTSRLRRSGQPARCDAEKALTRIARSQLLAAGHRGEEVLVCLRLAHLARAAVPSPRPATAA